MLRWQIVETVCLRAPARLESVQAPHLLDPFAESLGGPLKRLWVVAAITGAAVVTVATPSKAEVLTLTSAGNTISNGIFIGPYTLKTSDGSIFSVIL